MKIYFFFPDFFDWRFIFYIICRYEDYQEPPPPPPEPPPEEPPPEDPPPLDDGLDDIALCAEDIVLPIKLQNSYVENVLYPVYQFGACNAIVSNCSIHFFDTPNAYVYGNIS